MEPTIMRAAGAPVHLLNQSTITALANPGRGSGQLVAFHSRVVPGGPPPPPHAHRSDELVVVLAGALHLQVDDHVAVLGALDVGVVPAGGLHTVWVEDGDEPAELLVLGTAGHGYLDRDGTLLPDPPWAR